MKLSIGLLYHNSRIIENLVENLLLNDEIELVFIINNIKQLEDYLNNSVPDILLYIHHSKDPSSFQMLCYITRQFQPCKLIFYGANLDLKHVRKIIESGGNGYLHQSADLSMLLDACRLVGTGQLFIDPITQQQLVNDYIYGE